MPTLAEQCANPVHLNLRILDTSTGELGEALAMKKACGSRVATRCPSCSKVYQGDALALCRSGIVDSEGRQVPLTFLTLTAPGAETFGPVHSRRIKRSKRGKPHHYGCPCGRFHNEGDLMLGQPLDASTYDFDGASKWNEESSRLFSITFQRLARVVYGTDAKGKPLGKLSYIRVAEFQRRGLIHFHVLVRGHIDQRDFHAVVRGGVTSSGAHIEKVRHGARQWGRECHLANIVPGARFGVGAYLVKLVGYAVKSTGDDHDEGGLMGRRMRRAALQTCQCRSPIGCHAPLNQRPASGVTHVCARHRRARDGWGYRGHVLSKSRTWGSTFREIRAKRLPKGHAPLVSLRAFEKALQAGRRTAVPRFLAEWRRVLPIPPPA